MSGLLFGVLDNPGLVEALRNDVAADSDEVEDALRHALTSAALTVAQAGANPPWIQDFSLAISK